MPYNRYRFPSCVRAFPVALAVIGTKLRSLGPEPFHSERTLARTQYVAKPGDLMLGLYFRCGGHAESTAKKHQETTHVQDSPSAVDVLCAAATPPTRKKEPHK